LPFKSNPNQLIVEGYDDLQSVAALMGAYTPWNQDKHKSPVWIEISNGAQEILRDGFLSVYLKDPEIQTLGIMFDADTKPFERYARVSALCGKFFEFPDELPRKGVVLENSDQKRLGIWIMPDNSSEGDMETFLRYLIPQAAEEIWKHAVSCVTEAKQMGCPCHDTHLPKANLYTWLAWQNPPGQSPGRALTKQALDPQCETAGVFAKWFMDLYRLPPLRSPLPDDEILREG